MNIHKAIQTVRTYKGFSQRELGRKIGNDASQVRLLEDGSRTPGLRTLERICKALDLPLLALIFVAMEPAELRELDNKIVQSMNEIYVDFVEAK